MEQPWLQADIFNRKGLEKAAFVHDARKGALYIGIGQEVFSNKGRNDSPKSGGLGVNPWKNPNGEYEGKTRTRGGTSSWALCLGT